MDKAEKAYNKYVAMQRRLNVDMIWGDLSKHFSSDQANAVAKAIAKYVSATLRAGNYQVHVGADTEKLYHQMTEQVRVRLYGTQEVA